MKTLTKVVSASIIAIASIASAQAKEVVPTDNSVTTQICMAAVQGDKFKVHSVIKDSHLDKNFVVKNVKCNAQDILAFVAQHGDDSDQMIDMLLPSNRQNKVTITDIASL